MNNHERVEFVILGRVVGTATGWDECGDPGDMLLYGLIPAPSIKAEGDTTFCFGEGKVAWGFDEDGHPKNVCDIFEFFEGVPRKEPMETER